MFAARLDRAFDLVATVTILQQLFPRFRPGAARM